MKAGFYGRYSTDKQREASITDQLRNCQRYVEREGWKLAKSFKDEAQSGTRNDRPGYRAMLAAAERREFDVLLIDDLSRLSRDDIETKQTIKRFRYWGVRIVGVSDGFDSASKGAKVQAGVRGLINEIYIDDLREKTHRGMAGRALEGLNTGGRIYGYRHIPITDPTRKDQFGRPEIVGAKREVDPAQAKVVLRIFQMYADGNSPKQIAAELNRRGIKSPRGGTWATSCLYGDTRHMTGLLNQELYIGRRVWNRGYWRKDPDTGRRSWALKDASEWIVKDMPELRIVPQTIWDKVKARQQKQAKASARVRKGNPKARTGAGPKYLFSSLLKCSKCGANYIMSGPNVYGCSTNLYRGDAACGNKVRVSRKLIEERLLSAIKSDLFTPTSIAEFKSEVRTLLAEQKKAGRADDAQVRRDLDKADREIANIMSAIKAGILTPTTKAELEKAEAERARLSRGLKRTNGNLDNVEAILPRAMDRYRELVGNLEQTVSREMSRARNTVRELVGGSIRLVPTPGGGLNAELQGHYAGLVALANQGANKSGAGCPD